MTAYDALEWLDPTRDNLLSYQDTSKTMQELIDAVSEPKAGYQIHHIVEQTAAEREGYPRDMIDAPGNLVRIPTWKHQEITAWYQTNNPDFEGMSPRKYLRDKPWTIKREVGIQTLIDKDVLKP